MNKYDIKEYLEPNLIKLNKEYGLPLNDLGTITNEEQKIIQTVLSSTFGEHIHLVDAIFNSKTDFLKYKSSLMNRFPIKIASDLESQIRGYKIIVKEKEFRLTKIILNEKEILENIEKGIFEVQLIYKDKVEPI